MRNKELKQDKICVSYKYDSQNSSQLYTLIPKKTRNANNLFLFLNDIEKRITGEIRANVIKPCSQEVFASLVAGEHSVEGFVKWKKIGTYTQDTVKESEGIVQEILDLNFGNEIFSFYSYKGEDSTEIYGNLKERKHFFGKWNYTPLKNVSLTKILL